jgi:ABC-type nickel/cobalt efflux system permease component RcnA
VLHAAGPGHGKAVIAGYLMAGERALKRAPSTATQAKPAVSITVPAWLRPAAVRRSTTAPPPTSARATNLMAGERALKRGFTLSLLAALLQAVVALALVGGG